MSAALETVRHLSFKGEPTVFPWTISESRVTVSGPSNWMGTTLALVLHHESNHIARQYWSTDASIFDSTLKLPNYGFSPEPDESGLAVGPATFTGS